MKRFKILYPVKNRFVGINRHQDSRRKFAYDSLKEDDYLVWYKICLNLSSSAKLLAGPTLKSNHQETLFRVTDFSGQVHISIFNIDTWTMWSKILN